MNTLPDSRLLDPKGCVMADWAQPDGTTIRLEMEPIFCLNCGTPNGYVPRDVMSFVSFLCLPCSEKWGEHASNWATADQDFWDVVAFEMTERFGRSLTHSELCVLGEQGCLGTALDLLAKESPYKV